MRGEKKDENRALRNNEAGKTGQGKKENQNYCIDETFCCLLTVFS